MGTAPKRPEALASDMEPKFSGMSGASGGARARKRKRGGSRFAQRSYDRAREKSRSPSPAKGAGKGAARTRFSDAVDKVVIMEDEPAAALHQKSRASELLADEKDLRARRDPSPHPSWMDRLRAAKTNRRRLGAAKGNAKGGGKAKGGKSSATKQGGKGKHRGGRGVLR